MSTLISFVELGFRHIVDVEAMDHVLFLIVLAAIYRWRDVRQALWVITAFTVGHSITLGLAVTGVATPPSAVIEFLIPITILLTAVENLLVANRARAPWAGRYRPVFAGVFGLVHGAGFANYLRAMFVDHVAVPLLGFNLGIEVGQVVVLLLAAIAMTALDRGIEAVRSTSANWSVLRLRVIAVSTVVAVVASRWAAERRPW